MFAMTMSFGINTVPDPDPLIEELRRTPSSSRRAHLIRKLAQCDDAAVVPDIIPFLEGDGRVHRAAVEALVHIGEEARSPLLEVLGAPQRAVPVAVCRARR